MLKVEPGTAGDRVGAVISEGFSMDLADAKMQKQPSLLVIANWEKLGRDGDGRIISKYA